jgi:hypothetical protein
MIRRSFLAAFAASLAAVATSAFSKVNVDLNLAIGPPPPVVEVVPPPRVGMVWVPGYWEWDGRRHAWRKGRWMRERRGMRWEPAHWVEHDGRWRFVPGHWVRV